MPLTDPTRDLDFVLTRDVTQYREEFPYPWWLDGPHYNPPWVAPLHFYLAFLTIAVVVTAIRSICYKTIFQWIINFFEVAQEDQAELRESLSQLIYYTISWTWCAVWVMQQDFFWDTVYIWEGDFPFQPLPWTVYWLYAFNLGWYAHCTYAHFTWDNHKSDFWEMLIHHVVTLVLLYFSFVNGYWRLGCLVLYTHDVCDIFLHFAKACKFTIEKTLPDFVMTCIFVPFPLSWVVFRLILFPAMYVLSFPLFVLKHRC
ncbi:Ceramide synthase 5 [Balamuthia mandrillaris]